MIKLSPWQYLYKVKEPGFQQPSGFVHALSFTRLGSQISWSDIDTLPSGERLQFATEHGP